MPPELIAAAGRFCGLVGRGALVLDVGCGAGRDMAWLESLGLSVVGLDHSSGMLAQARARARGPLLQMDMRFLGLTTGKFDGVWCCASLLHLPKGDAPAALTEMGRILQRGGLLFLSMQEGDGQAWEACPYAPVERFFARYTHEELASLLAQTAFSVVETASNEGGPRRWLQVFARSRRSP
jgi:ubiquinone/menaquinone biosynthesis C-methylase UbiE